MIASFDDPDLLDLFHGIPNETVSREGEEVTPAIHRTLDLLNAAHGLGDLRAARGLALEPIEGMQLGWESVRVDARHWIRFRWVGDGLFIDLKLVRRGRP